jgi:hypothetical protein
MAEGLRIVSDGTREGTHVFLDDAEVHDVTAVTWNFSPKARKTTVTLEISNVGMDSLTHASPDLRDQVTAMMEHATPH